MEFAPTGGLLWNFRQAWCLPSHMSETTGLQPADIDETASPVHGEDDTYSTPGHASGTEGEDDLDAYEAMKAALFEPAAPPDEAEPEAQPEEDGDEPDEEPEAGADPAEPEPEPGEDIKPRQRVEAHDETNALAMTLYRKAKAAGKPVDFDVAFQRAKLALGIEDKSAAPEPAAAEPDKPAAPDLTEIETKLASLKEERRLAKDDLDMDRVDELDEEIDRLQDQRIEARDAAREAALRQQAEFDEQWNASTASLLDVYPDFGQEGSAAWQGMAELHAKLVKLGDPDASGPDAPLYVGRQVAKALGLTPALSVVAKPGASTNAASSKRPAASSPSLPGRGPQPASGATGSASPATSLAEFYSRASLDDYEEMQRFLTGRG